MSSPTRRDPTRVADRGAVASTVALIFSAALLVGGTIAYVLVPSPAKLSTPEREVSPGADQTLQASDEPPSHIVAVRDDGRLLLLRSADGSVESVLGVTVAVANGETPGVAATETVQEAYVADPGTQQIRFVRLATGDVQTETDGAQPALGPHDDRMAFVRSGSDGPPHVLIRDLTTGDERDLGPVTDIAGAISVADMTYGPLGAQLVVAARAADGSTSLWALDAEHQALRDARRLGPDTGDGSSWSMARPYDDHLLVVRQCCGATSTSTTLQEVDPSTGAVVGSPEIDLPSPIAAIDTDATRHFVLVVTTDGTLWQWDGQGRPMRLASGVAGAAW